MAKYGSDDVRLLVDGYDLSGDTFELEVTKEAALQESHAFGDDWVELLAPGVQQGTITHQSFYDDANDKTEEALVEQEGTERVLMAIMSNAQSGQAVCFQGAMQRNNVRGVTRNELHKISAEYLSSARIDECTLLQSLAAESGDGATSDGSLDNSSSSSDGGPAYIEVTALTLGGYDNVIVKVQESSDDGTDPWADVVTFPTVTVAPTAARVVISSGSTVEQWLRVTLTWTGSGSGESVTLAVGFLRD